MKKALLLFLSLVLALSMLTILSGCGDKVTQGLVFESNGDGTCTWTGMGSCADTEVFVPDQNQGEMVTAVGENVLGEGSLVTAVDLPDTVKTIGEGAFADSGELTTIDLGNGLETIERDAFAHCEKLQSVKFPPSLRTIGRYAFDGAVSMTEIVLPEGVTTVEEYAFVRTSNVKKISLPASLHDLVSYCYDFTSLEELEWENAIQYYCLSVDNNYISSVNKEAYPLISYAILAADEDKSAHKGLLSDIPADGADAIICAALGKNRLIFNGKEIEASGTPLPGGYDADALPDMHLEIAADGELAIFDRQQEIAQGTYRLEESENVYYATLLDGTIELAFKAYGGVLAVAVQEGDSKADGIFLLQQ